MREGKVKWFDDTKGFGFIEDLETGEEYFVHVTKILETIEQDDVVEFELMDGKKGKNAINVKVK